MSTPQTPPKLKPIEPYKIPELQDRPKPAQEAPPSVEITERKVILRKVPNRPHHLCLGCAHHFEYVRQRDAGPRPTGRTFAEWVSYCAVGPELLDLSSETIYRCTKHRNRALRRALLGALIAGVFGIGAWFALDAIKPWPVAPVMTDASIPVADTGLLERTTP